MNRAEWLTSKDLAAFLAKHRDNDVRVEVHGVNVPLADAYYNRAADMITLHLDEESEDYKIAMSADPIVIEEAG